LELEILVIDAKKLSKSDLRKLVIQVKALAEAEKRKSLKEDL
jgi:hypothetical protein